MEHDRVVRVLDEARRLASVRVACAHRDSRRHVQPSHVARLTATHQQVVVRQELELPWRADAAQTVQLRPLAVVDVQVLRLGRREHVPVMQEARVVDAFIRMELAH